jgi:hypothetical protein
MRKLEWARGLLFNPGKHRSSGKVRNNRETRKNAPKLGSTLDMRARFVANRTYSQGLRVTLSATYSQQVRVAPKPNSTPRDFLWSEAGVPAQIDVANSCQPDVANHVAKSPSDVATLAPTVGNVCSLMATWRGGVKYSRHLLCHLSLCLFLNGKEMATLCLPASSGNHLTCTIVIQDTA